MDHFMKSHHCTRGSLHHAKLKPRLWGSLNPRLFAGFYHWKGHFKEVDDVVQEYITLGYAEPVPPSDLSKNYSHTFNLLMHAVHKETSTSTKV